MFSKDGIFIPLWALFTEINCSVQGPFLLTQVSQMLDEWGIACALLLNQLQDCSFSEYLSNHLNATEMCTFYEAEVRKLAQFLNILTLAEYYVP